MGRCAAPFSLKAHVDNPVFTMGIEMEADQRSLSLDYVVIWTVHLCGGRVSWLDTENKICFKKKRLFLG